MAMERENQFQGHRWGEVSWLYDLLGMGTNGEDLGNWMDLSAFNMIRVTGVEEEEGMVAEDGETQ